MKSGFGLSESPVNLWEAMGLVFDVGVHSHALEASVTIYAGSYSDSKFLVPLTGSMARIHTVEFKRFPQGYGQ